MFWLATALQSPDLGQSLMENGPWLQLSRQEPHLKHLLTKFQTAQQAF
jgi:hypothetical protein